MDNRVVQIGAGLLISGALGVGFVMFSDSEPAPGFGQASLPQPVHSVKTPPTLKPLNKNQPNSVNRRNERKNRLSERKHKVAKTPEEILEQLKSSDPEVRADGFLSIRYSKEPLPFDLPPLLGYMQGGVNDSNEEVRESAMEAAGEYTDDPRILPVFEAALQGSFSEEKSTALNHVFNMEWTPDVERLVVFRLWDADPEVAEQAFEVLSHNSDEEMDDIQQAREKFDGYSKGGL